MTETDIGTDKQMIEMALTIALGIILVPIILWAGLLVVVAIVKVLT